MSRPEEIQWWIKRKRLIGLSPQITNSIEYGATWMLWWIKMQPVWREGESLVKVQSTNTDWEPILRGGSNGLFLVVTSLSWWVYAIGPDNQFHSELVKAITDVEWVLSELVTVLSSGKTEAGMKRPLEDSPNKEPRAKRCV
jgi:hypothetical protein